MVRDYGMTRDDAEIVVTLAALLHCIGMSVHRARPRGLHRSSSPSRSCSELLDGLYDEPERTVIVSEVLQAIISHRADGQPLTLEAGIIRVADALDMAKGRSRIPFERGRVSMHSLSAAAIEDVTITDGEDRPIRIEIRMNNSLRDLPGRRPAEGEAPRLGPRAVRRGASRTSTPRPRSASCRCTGSRSSPAGLPAHASADVDAIDVVAAASSAPRCRRTRSRRGRASPRRRSCRSPVRRRIDPHECVRRAARDEDRAVVGDGGVLRMARPRGSSRRPCASRGSTRETVPVAEVRHPDRRRRDGERARRVADADRGHPAGSRVDAEDPAAALAARPTRRPRRSGGSPATPLPGHPETLCRTRFVFGLIRAT